MIVAYNLMANFTKRNLGINDKTLSRISEKLSTGYRINRAADDAAGLAISEEMRGQIRGLNKSVENIQQGSDFCQVADGAMQELSSIVQRMRELSVKAANDTYVDEDRKAIQNEIESLADEVTRITDDTAYNTIKVFQKHRQRTAYEINGTKRIPISKEVTTITGQNYGITEVLGKDHVYQGKYMDDKIQFTSSGWHHTGDAPKARASSGSTVIYTYDSNGNNHKQDASGHGDIINYLNTTYTINVPATSNSSSMSFTSQDGKSTIELTYGKYYDVSGNPLLSGYKIETYDKDVNDATKKLVRKESNNNVYYWSDGTSGVGTSTTYGSAWFDFSGLGTDYKIDNLYGQAFNTVCGHGCGCHYNIIFSGDKQASTNADGVNYSFENKSGNPTITLNISGCTSGADIVKSIVSAANSNSQFTSHYNQFAYNDADPAKLYIYDSQPGAMSDVFQPIAWTKRKSDSEIITTWIEVPNTTRAYKYEDYHLYLQAGSNSRQSIELYTPWLNATNMGLDNLNLLTQEGAESAISSCDDAIQKLNDERTTVGALSNRLDHAYANNANESENLQAAESKLRDANIADNMVEYSAKSILQQAGQSMLAQANKANEGILTLLQR